MAFSLYSSTECKHVVFAFQRDVRFRILQIEARVISFMAC